MQLLDHLASIPGTYIRGGTSKGLHVLESSMPADRTLWGPMIISMFGAGDPRQIDGIGGAQPTTSKCCIVGPSRHPLADVDYTFAQVGIAEEEVQWDINCGNLTASVGVFAILSGLVAPASPVTRVRVYQTNTRSLVEIHVPFGAGGMPVEGDLAIGGVPGSGAAVGIDFSKTSGATLKRGVLPTGRRRDVLDVPGIGRIECSIVDLANMCVFFRARDLGLTGYEMPHRAPELLERFMAIKRAAQALLQMDATRTTPWPVMVAPPRAYTTLMGAECPAEAFDLSVRAVGAATSVMHKAFAGTASSCCAAAAKIAGSIVHEVLGQGRPGAQSRERIVLAHASGLVELSAEAEESSDRVQVRKVIFERTARVIMQGEVFYRPARIQEMVDKLASSSLTRAGVPLPGAPDPSAAEGGRDRHPESVAASGYA